MIVLIITGLLALLLVYLAQRGSLKNGLEIGFIIVTIVAALHYDFGADYWAYYDYFYEWNRYNSGGWSYSSLTDVFRDPGWVFLCFICKPIGFFGMIALLSVIQNAIYYFFIKKYVQITDWTLAFFIYLFTIDLYPMNLSMMRQGLAVSLFVMALPLVLNKKWLQSILIMLFAISVHMTAIVVLPFLLLTLLPFRNGKYICLFVLVSFGILFIYRESLGFLLAPLDVFEDISEKIARSEEAYGQLTSFGLGFIVKSIPFMVGLWYLWHNKQWDIIKSPIVAVATIGYLFIPMAAQVYMLQRLYIYFQALTIMTIPTSYAIINNKIVRRGLLTLLILMTLYEYWAFFTSDVYKDTFYQYRTIFEAL